MSGSKSAPGGQLVQATDEYVGVRNARLVLIDDTGVRATMTASWLIQMGWREVYVLEGGLSCDSLRTGPETSRLLGADKLVAADDHCYGAGRQACQGGNRGIRRCK